MAALSIIPLCQFKHRPILGNSTRNDSRMFTAVSCHNRDRDDPFDAEIKEAKGDKGSTLWKFLVGAEKLGKGLQDSLSPKRKGDDWKDITLMSLSFAVYVYMSQKIVCAYCVWTSMLRQPW